MNQKFNFLPNEYVSTKLLFGSLHPNPVVEYKVRAGRSKSIEGELKLTDFIDIKGWKSLGNKLSDSKLISVKAIHKEIEPSEEDDDAKAKAKASKREATEEDKQNTLF